MGKGLSNTAQCFLKMYFSYCFGFKEYTTSRTPYSTFFTYVSVGSGN